MNPCPVPWCLRSLEWATACFAAGWLLWVPLAIANGKVPGLMVKLAIAFAVAGCILSIGVSTWTCLPCGG